MKEFYLEMLNDFNSVDVKNYTLDKVYDKEWFKNDLEKIFSFYNKHQSDRKLENDLELWMCFLHGCVEGRYL